MHIPQKKTPFPLFFISTTQGCNFRNLFFYIYYSQYGHELHINFAFKKHRKVVRLFIWSATSAKRDILYIGIIKETPASVLII